MKKFTNITSAILLLSISLFAQAPDTVWTKTYGGVSEEWGHFVQQTSDLGYIIAGATESYGAGSTDIYLIKTDYLGDTLWTKTYGGPNADIAYSVQQTNDGGYVIVGQTYSYGAGGSDVWLIKTDASGNVIWTKTYGGSNNEHGVSVKQTTDGGYIISGTDAYDFSPYDDVYIIKTNSLGDTLWTKTWNRPDANNDDRGGEIQLTDDGGYIMVGHSYNNNGNGIKVTLLKLNSSGVIEWWKAHRIEHEQRGSSVLQTDDGGYIFSAYTGQANPDFWLVKTDSAGDTLWSKRFGGPNDEYPGQMWQTADSGYVIVGYTASFGSGGNDVWLVKTDMNGNEMWNLPIGSSGDDRGVSVQQTMDRGFIIAGRTNSFSSGDYDVWIIKLTLIEWVLQNSGTTSTLFGVSFSDENNGTAVGGNTILRTTNGGNTWTFQHGGGAIGLYKVCFTDEDNGTIIGHNGIILRTTNGGINWTPQSSGTTNDLKDVSFTDSNYGTVVGDGPIILRTTNGGTTWIPQTSPVTSYLSGVSFIDVNNGWIVGANGTILKTTNGGTNWALIASSSGGYNDVCFTDLNHGTAVGGGGIIVRTTDGGSTWITQTSGTFAWLWGVSFTDANNGTTVGRSGTILRTTDGGTTWFEQYGWTTEALLDVSFTDPYNGTVVGWDGIILRSSIPVITFQLTVSIDNGWNMVSIPGLHPDNQNVETWWSGKDPTAKVFKFNSIYQTVTTATPSEGYWMKHSGAQVYNTGDEWPAGGILIVTHNPIVATAGWNLIGGYESIVPTGSLTTTPPGLISTV